MQYHFPLPKIEALSEEDFMIAASNREAALWAMERKPESWAGSCLIFYGPKGCGKTHLLHVWAKKHKAKIIQSLDDIIGDILTPETCPKALALDNADKVCGNPEAEEWLQHLYNAAQSTRTPLLLASDHPPSAWPLLLQDIASRLRSCPAIPINEPDDDLMRGILIKLFNDRQLIIDYGVIDYLATRLERTGGALQEAVQELDKRSLDEKHKISIPFAKKVLIEVLPKNQE